LAEPVIAGAAGSSSQQNRMVWQQGVRAASRTGSHYEPVYLDGLAALELRVGADASLHAGYRYDDYLFCRRQDRQIQSAILLGADQLLAVEQQHRRFPEVFKPQLWHRATSAQFRNSCCTATDGFLKQGIPGLRRRRAVSEYGKYRKAAEVGRGAYRNRLQLLVDGFHLN